MSKPATCKVCGQALDKHVVELRDGVAHTVVYENGRRYDCSAIEGERRYLFGEIRALQTIIRSLRNRAGRLRNHGQTWDASDVYAYTNKLVADQERLIGLEQRYYARKDRGDE